MLLKEELEKLYKKGLLMKEISQKEGWSYYAVKYWMKKHNIARRSRSEVSYLNYWHPRGVFPSNRAINPLTIDELRSFYYKKGLSAKEVGKVLGRSETSIYKLMERHNLPRRSPAETNAIAYEKKEASYILKKHLNVEDEKLRMAGIMLYWAEGTKLNLINRSSTVDFTNSDPQMIKLFLKFLRQICGVQGRRLRVLLYCYANQDIDALKKYWRKVTSIPLSQFTKPYIRKDFLPEKSDKMKYGLVHIRYADKKLLIQINNWVKEYLKRNNIQG